MNLKRPVVSVALQCALCVALSSAALGQSADTIESVAFPDTGPGDSARELTRSAEDTGGAIAGVLCLQPAANCQNPDAANALNSSGTGFRVADDFNVSSNGTIAALCWSGVYTSGTTDCSGTAVDAFTVRIYNDNNGIPGSLLGTFTQGTSLTVNRANSGRTLGAFTIIEYTATLAGPAVLAANCYWLEITNSLTGCTWFWETGSGAGAYAAAAQDANNSYSAADVVQADLAFCVNLALLDPTVQPCAPSAPANDNCAQAQLLTLNVPVTADLRGATTNAADPQFSCLTGGAGPGEGSVWYRFVATSPQHRISTCGSAGNDSIVAVYSGACGNLTEVACNDDTCDLLSEICVSNLTPGTTYFVQLAAFNDVARGVYTLLVGGCLSCQAHQPAGGYIISPSITGVVAAWDDLQPGATGSISTMTLQGTWWNGVQGAGSRAAEPTLANEIFTLRIFQQGAGALPETLLAERSTVDANLTFLSRTDTNTFFEFNGVGGFQDNFDCSIFDYVIEFDPIPLSSGVCYWMTIQNEGTGTDNAARFRWLGGSRAVMTAGNDRRAFDANNNGVDATELRTGDYIWCFDLLMNDPTSCANTTPPSNDSCANATVVACGGAPVELIASLQNATEEGSDPIPTCIGAAVEGTVWYRITTGAAPATFLVETCPSTFSGINDTVLAVYTAGPGGCPSALTEVACANDNCGDSVAFEEIRIDPALPNTTYFVMLAAPDALSQLSYRIRFTCPAPPTPPNDACANAAPLTIGTPEQGTTLNSTLDQNAVAAGACNQVDVLNKGVWHTVVGNGSTLEASLCTLTGFDSLISIYCATCDNLTCVTADDDGCGPIGGPSRVQWCAKNGATYHILVHNFPGDAGGTYEILISDVGPGGCTPTPDCPASACPGPRGDSNCDGLINFFDIDPFVTSLFDLPGYQAQFCNGSICAVDIDCSGLINFFDIDPFLDCLFTTCPACAP